MGLLRDQAVAVEDAPDGGSGGDGLEALGQVVKDGLRTGVETCSRELSAKLEDVSGDSGPPLEVAAWSWGAFSSRRWF